MIKNPVKLFQLPDKKARNKKDFTET